MFISHASEDKDCFARPLAEALRTRGLRVWFDEFTLRVGDSLRRSIDRGLAHASFGVVIISPSFLAKEWPQKELDGLVAREVHGHKVILPVWHNVDADTVRSYSLILADRLATSSAKGLEKVRLFVGHRPKAEHCAPRGEERIVRGVPSPVDLGVAKRVLLSVAGQGGTYSHGTVDL